jgi:hypothetical protein
MVLIYPGQSLFLKSKMTYGTEHGIAVQCTIFIYETIDLNRCEELRPASVTIEVTIREDYKSTGV